MAKIEKLRVKKTTEAIRTWTRKEANRDGLRDDSLQDINAIFAQSSRDDGSFARLAVNLEFLHIWYAAVAGLQILEGGQTGWQEFHRAVNYRMLGMQITCEVIDRAAKENKGSILANHAALLLAHALAIGDYGMANWVAERMLRSLSDDMFTGWDVMAFEPFMLKLCARWKKEAPDWTKHKLAKLGPYQAVFDSWDSNAALAEALVRVCDYHIEYADARSDEYLDQFAPHPYDIYPLEILAVFRVREKEGLPSCSVDHPLMKSPLADVPRSPPMVADKLLHDVRSRAVEFFGERIEGTP